MTASLNAGPFIEQTLGSVLGQGYPNLEYIVNDGGSTDGTRETIEKYGRLLTHWESGPDSGQGAAINRGLSQATGDILCWLNADDYFLPGTLSYVAEEFGGGDVSLLSGACLMLDEARGSARVREAPRALDAAALAVSDPLLQPATFWTRRLWERVGLLDESLRFTLDWDWFNRAVRCGGCHFKATRRLLSVYRLHAGHKTGQGGCQRRAEIRVIVERYAEAPWPSVFASVDEGVVRGLAMLRRITRRRGLWVLRPLLDRAYLCLRLPGVCTRWGLRRTARAAAILSS